jgi:hypothetical protein
MQHAAYIQRQATGNTQHAASSRQAYSPSPPPPNPLNSTSKFHIPDPKTEDSWGCSHWLDNVYYFIHGITYKKGRIRRVENHDQDQGDRYRKHHPSSIVLATHQPT